MSMIDSRLKPSTTSTVVPCARLVGPAVTHQMRRAGHRIDQFRGDVGGRVGQQGQESAHGASMPNSGANYDGHSIGEVCRDQHLCHSPVAALHPCRVVYAA